MLTRRPGEPLLAYQARQTQSNRDKMNNRQPNTRRRSPRNPNPPGPSRGRLPPRQRRNSNISALARGETSQQFIFTVDDLKANSNGILRFGPNLTQYAAFSNGVMKSYHDYRISQIQVSYVTNASSTTPGAIAIEWDSSCAQTKLASKVTSFPVAKSFTRTFGSGVVNGSVKRNTSVEQIWMLYAGNASSSDIAGQFIIRMTVHFSNPK
nr:MAG TPA: coat protein [Riboviria sp.]